MVSFAWHKINKPGKTTKCYAAVSKLNNMNAYNNLQCISEISLRVYWCFPLQQSA